MTGSAMPHDADFVFGTRGYGWGGLQVARFHAREEISRPFEVDLVLARQAALGPIDLDELVGAPSTLAIATDAGWRRQHGIVSECARIEQTEGTILYHAKLVPHLWRASLRQGCRNFVDRTLEEIVAAVLEGRSPTGQLSKHGLIRASDEPKPPPRTLATDAFVLPVGTYRWRVVDDGVAARLRDRRARSYVVQYQESDLAFVSRVLEEERISYFFEHGEHELVMVLCDHPGGGAPYRAEQYTLLNSAGRAGDGATQPQVIASFQEQRNLAAPSLTMDPRDSQRAMADCSGTVRRLVPGHLFELRDHARQIRDQDLLTISVETWAVQLELPHTELFAEPFGPAGHRGTGRGMWSRFRVLSGQAHFCPPLRTPKPRIDGLHTAVVWSSSESDGGGDDRALTQGQVRLRFAWDEGPEDGRPPSCAVSVATPCAPSGENGLFMPPANHEVLVGYLEGDPERPFVVGRAGGEAAAALAAPLGHAADGHDLHVTGDQKVSVTGCSLLDVPSGARTVRARETRFQQTRFDVHSGPAALSVRDACQATIDSGAGAKVVSSGDQLVLAARNITLDATNVTLKGVKLVLEADHIDSRKARLEPTR